MSLFAASACIPDDGGEPAIGEPFAGEPSTSETRASLTLGERIAACQNDVRVAVGKVSVDTCVGADLFFRETFGGNGRSCGTCHPVDRNLTIDPQFISTLASSDPLFVAEFNPALAGLEKPAQMRQFGLILENVDGFAPDPRTRFVLRSVPHSLSLVTSITRPADDPLAAPVERTGWSGDGAPGNGSLRNFQNGAITQHYTRRLARTAGDFRLATDDELNRIDAYLRRVGRLNDLDVASVRMTDAGAEAGRVKFLAIACNTCHFNAGANASFGAPGNRSFNTGVEASRHLALAGFPLDGGFGQAPANGDGSFGNGAFNTPPLVEAADTGPFFHTATRVVGASAHNTDFATTIEQAVAFYDSDGFRNSPSGPASNIDLTAGEIDNIARFLRGINAAFNVAQAVKRLDAAAAVTLRFGDGALAFQFELLRLAEIELRDAVSVLNAVGIQPNVVTGLHTAISRIHTAITAFTSAQRRNATLQAQEAAANAAAQIGTNLNYQIGEGTVMF